MTSSVRAKMAQVEKEKKVARREAIANPEVATEMVRARSDKGHYIADDPSTPENEAWVEKPKKKAAPKKKAPAKKKTASKSQWRHNKTLQQNCQTPKISGYFLKLWDKYLYSPMDCIMSYYGDHMDALNLAEYLYKKLRQRRDDIQVSLGTGNIGSFDDYKYAVGQVKGLTFMEEEIKTAMKNIELSDE